MAWRWRGIAVILAALFTAAATGMRTAETITTSDASVKEDLVRGVEQIIAGQGGIKLAPQLVRTLERLRRERGSTATGRRGRTLAIQGFTWTLKGVRTQLDMAKYDSGNLEASVRDAKRADRYLNRGANLLRAAGRSFGISIGKLNGH
jgi:hypothetical protein